MDTYSKHTVFQVLICAVEKVNLGNVGENADVASFRMMQLRMRQKQKT